MARKFIPRVTVGYRVIATVDRDGEPALLPISRIFHAKKAGEEFVEQARKAGHADAYLQEVVRPERKEVAIG